MTAVPKLAAILLAQASTLLAVSGAAQSSGPDLSPGEAEARASDVLSAPGPLESDDPVEMSGFRIEKLPKVEGTFRWVDEKTIVVSYGLSLEVVRHDEKWFWVKIWESERRLPEPFQSRSEAVTTESVAARYRLGLRVVDRLELRSFDEGLPRTGQWRHSFDLADVDGDGHLDLVSGPPRKSRRPRPAIFLGDGKGHWRRAKVSFPPAAYDYGGTAAGDLNGDGRPDLVFGVHLRGVLALVAEGENRFQLWSAGLPWLDPRRGTGRAGYSARKVELFDWNGDGRLDILALGEGPRGGRTGEFRGGITNSARGLRVFLNQGNGRWAAQRPGELEWSRAHFGDDLALGDFDRDGQVDIALASRAAFRKSIVGLRGSDGLWRGTSLDVLPPAALVGAVAVVDADGNGASELIAGLTNRDRDQVGRTVIDLYSLEVGEGPLARRDWTRRPLVVTEDRRGVYAMDTGDIDGDGFFDLVALTGDGDLWLLLGGDGGFVREAVPEAPPPVRGCRGYDVRLADLDGDGADEIVAAFAGEPEGFPGIVGASHPGCSGEGGLRAWKAGPR